MKKAIAILLVLLVAGVVFGSTTELTVDATVAGAPIYIAISNGSEITSLGVSAFQGADIGSVDFGEIDPEAASAPTIANLFANVRVNKQDDFDVRISAQDLTHTTVTGSSIRYTVGSVESSASLASEVPTTPESVLLTVIGSSITGMSVLSESFDIVLSSGAEDALSYQNALEGAYQGTVNFWVTAQ